jgi:hypothetical protein
LQDYFHTAERFLKSLQADDVQFQSGFSKEAMRKLLQQHPATAISKAVSSLSRKSRKNFQQSDVGNELWHTVKARLVAEWTRSGEIIALCYPQLGEALCMSPEQLSASLAAVAKSSHKHEAPKHEKQEAPKQERIRSVTLSDDKSRKLSRKRSTTEAKPRSAQRE